MKIASKPTSAALAASLACALLSGSAHAKDPPLSTLTPQHFAESATVEENPASGTTTISTEPGFVEHTGLMRMVWHDEFLEGLVDRKTGRGSFRVIVSIVYGGKLRSYETATFAAAQGVNSVPAAVLGREVVNCAVGDCTYTERVAFPVDEELLRHAAASRAPGTPGLWRFTLAAKSGPDYTGVLAVAEIAGFLAKVDDYVANLPAVKASAATASLKLELGIGGLPVEATAEYPNRSGILVTAVNRDSVAQKAGIIVGDIIHRFNGHAIGALSDLEAALAGSAAGSAAPLDVYRGTAEMALTARF